MSLTGWIKWDEKLLDTVIDAVWGVTDAEKQTRVPTKKLTGIMKAPPCTTNYALVGQAFDYALRMRITLLNSSDPELFWKNGLVAENGVRGNRKRRDFIDQTKKRWCAVFTAEKGVIIDSFLPACITLAKMERVYRSGQNMSNAEIFSVDDRDVSDLRCLSGLIEPAMWKSSKQLILNPTFGLSSTLVGGADADLIVDGTLIDIKTTKYLDFRREYLRQLLGYYILNLREGNPYKIDSLGIYFSRHGVLFKFPVAATRVIGAIIWTAIEASLQEYGCGDDSEDSL